MHFSSLPHPKPDPLFAINAEAVRAGPEAINGTIGIFMDEEGKPLVHPSVLRAITDIQANLPSFDYSYPSLLGLPAFRAAVTRLIGGSEPFIASIASTGGTGALAINIRLLAMMLKTEWEEILLPVPTWVNHGAVCKWAKLRPVEVPIIEGGKVSVERLVDAIRARSKPFGILLQVGCHNPTGLDFSPEDWEVIFAELQKKPCAVILDFAYQGFKDHPEMDREPILRCRAAGLPTLVAWSASKNHSIYGLRTGLAAAIVDSEEEKQCVEGNYCSIVRGLHSAAPTFGQAIVARTQEQYGDAWRSDLHSARSTIQRKRELMKNALPDAFHASLKGYGMFAMLPLTQAQILKLKVEHSVFLPLDGRINIAGIPEKRVGEMCGKICHVIG